MKRLWKTIPPCLSDLLGVQALMNSTEGVGIVDDASGYKPLRYTKAGAAGRPGGRHDRSGRTGGKGAGFFGSERIVSSDITEADIITGTAERVWRAAAAAAETCHPAFALLTTAPCAAMIGTDLTETADRIQAEYHIPAAVVNLDGQKDFLYGISMALEAMGKLLLEQRDTRPNTVNLLGCHSIDWPEEMVRETERWLASKGWQVLSRWGSRETTENLRNGAAASVNLVVDVSGLRLARYMEARFGVPCVVGAPFGAARCAQLLEELRSGTRPPRPERSADAPEALVIGEQLAGDAIRCALEARGFSSVRVCSFHEMDKGEMRPGDKKLVSEEELAAELANDRLRIVFGDIDYRMGSQVKWAPLPNQGNLAPSSLLAPFSMTDGALDRWLDGILKEETV